MTAPVSATIASLPKRDRVILLVAAALVLTFAWLLLLHDQPLAGRSFGQALTPHPGSAGAVGLGLAASMWMVMMVAMMLPAAMPSILLFAALDGERRAGRSPLVSTALLVAGYFALWSAYSLAAALFQLQLQHSLLSPAEDLRLELFAGGTLILVAGGFQLSPLKTACLRHCRSPLGFFLSRWRDGPVGAFGMGMRHGAYCLGCCWALMALSFAVGVMNLLWMAVLALVVCVEKLAPGGAKMSRLFGWIFLAWGACQVVLSLV